MIDHSTKVAREIVATGYPISPWLKSTLVRRIAAALRNHPDTLRINRLERNEWNLRCHRESYEGDWRIWWNVVKRSTGKPLDHPQGNARAAIDAIKQREGGKP